MREGNGAGRAVALVAQAACAPDEDLALILGGQLRVSRVRSRAALLAALCEQIPDLLVLDVERLEGEGWSALEALHRSPPEEEVPILVLGDDVRGEGLSRAFALGATEYVRRGAPDGELIARVEQVQRRARQRRMLKALAQTDGLTGLSNFRTLSERLEEEFKRSQRYRHPLAVVMLDVDHLKEINDRFGHEAGNRALLGFVRHLRTNLREVDFAARYGGDEFVVLLPHQTATEAAVFAERLRLGLKKVRFPVRDDGDAELSMTVSVGVADHTPIQPCVSAPELLEAADSALYDAKSSGRDRLVVFSPGQGLGLTPCLPR